MTVAELITRLQALPRQDRVVYVGSENGLTEPIVIPYAVERDGEVVTSPGFVVIEPAAE